MAQNTQDIPPRYPLSDGVGPARVRGCRQHVNDFRDMLGTQPDDYVANYGSEEMA